MCRDGLPILGLAIDAGRNGDVTFFFIADILCTRFGIDESILRREGLILCKAGQGTSRLDCRVTENLHVTGIDNDSRGRLSRGFEEWNEGCEQVLLRYEIMGICGLLKRDIWLSDSILELRIARWQSPVRTHT